MKKLLFLSLLLLFASCQKESSEIETQKYYVTTNVNPPEGGYVNPQNGIYNELESVTLTAIPNQFYSFIGWSGSITSNTPELSFTIITDTQLVANFSLLDSDEDGFTDDIDACPNQGIGALMGSDGCKISLFYFDDNGVTIKAISQAEIGMEDELNGSNYVLVDNNLLRQKIENGDDLSYVVTSRVTNMSELFFEKQINGNISSWDVSNVVNMERTFHSATNVNQEIGYWDVSNVQNMFAMFHRSNFNKPIGNWDVSKVRNMSTMFHESTEFNQPIGNWDVSDVYTMTRMFYGASKFNQPIGNWDVSGVQNMGEMFYGASEFDQSIGNWDVSNVTKMYAMFSNSSFNQPIANWNVRKVERMQWMFQSTPFNQPIGNWEVWNVRDMEGMFYNSTNFNQNISNWSVDEVLTCGDFNLNGILQQSYYPNFRRCNPN